MNVTSKLMGIPLLTWVFLCTSAHAWKVDCTKFVFAPRCRGVAAKRGGEVASYTGQRWQPDETWMLYNRPADFSDDTVREMASHAQSKDASSITAGDDKVLRLLSKILGVTDNKTPQPRYNIDRRTNEDRIKVYFDALLQSLEDTAEGDLKEDVMVGSP